MTAPSPAARAFASSRERLLFAAALALLTALSLAPVWASRFLPLLDEPNHLSAITVWRHLADGDPLFTRYYEAHVAPVSYLAHYGLAFLLSWPFGVEAAHKLVLCLSFAALPCAAVLWCRQTGRSPWLALATLPLLFSSSWAHGFHSFNLGMSSFLLGVVAVDALLLAPSPLRVVGATAASVTCYLCHPFPLMLLLLCTPVLLLLHGLPRRASVLTLLSFVPCAGLLAWQSHATHVPVGSAAKVLGPTFPVLSPALWLERVRDFPSLAVNPLAGELDSRLFLALFALVVALGVASLRGSLDGPKVPFRLAQRGLVLALVLAVAYFVLPEHFDEPVYMWIARGRIAPAIAFFVLLSPRIASTSRLRFVALALALPVAFVPIEVTRHYLAFGREMNAMEQVVLACPEGVPLLTIRVGDTMHRDYDVPLFRQLPSWVQVLHGGFSPQWFPRPIPFPFEVKRTLKSPHWRRHETYRSYLDRKVYGCVLTHRLKAKLPDNAWKLAAEAGAFRLYRALPGR